MLLLASLNVAVVSRAVDVVPNVVDLLFDVPGTSAVKESRPLLMQGVGFLLQKNRGLEAKTEMFFDFMRRTYGKT